MVSIVERESLVEHRYVCMYGPIPAAPAAQLAPSRLDFEVSYYRVPGIHQQYHIVYYIMLHTGFDFFGGFLFVCSSCHNPPPLVRSAVVFTRREYISGVCTYVNQIYRVEGKCSCTTFYNILRESYE